MKSWLPLSVLFLIGFANVHADISAKEQVRPGIVTWSETRTDPPTRMFVAVIDLKNPNVHLRVAAGGADPDGPGKWETTLMTPTAIAAREHFDLVVNGDFFTADRVKDAEGKEAPYREGMSAAVVGTAVTDGKAWSIAPKERPCLVVHNNRRVTIEMIAKPPPDDWEVIGGNTLLLKDGKPAYPDDKKLLHPRTVVGLDATGTKLTLLVVDGRKPFVAVGMSYADLAREMLRLGCTDALNLDGGGSSVMAVREAKTNEYKILNQPTDGTERAVADVLGVSVDR